MKIIVILSPVHSAPLLTAAGASPSAVERCRCEIGRSGWILLAAVWPLCGHTPGTL